MPLDSPQLIEFANTDLRQIADQLTRALTRAEGANATYIARNLGTVITDGGAGNPILDGSDVDGRTICVGGDVFNFITLLTDFAAFMTQGRRDVLAKWQVNGDR